MNQTKLNVFQTIVDVKTAINNAERELLELEQLRAIAFDEPVQPTIIRNPILRRNRFYILATDD